jgi:predicted TIM-barrel fold metal-dependent hydrolase
MKGIIMNINNNVQMHKIMFSSNLTLEDMPHREHKLRNIAKVENFKSVRSGKPVANQFKITLQNGIEIFQSYESIICIKANNETYLDYNRWNYSNTTSRYRKEFLGEDTKTTKQKIEQGKYILEYLNQKLY